MSFTIVEQSAPRLNRSELAVPGSQPKFFEKAAKGDADVIFLDLEDAVAPDDKEAARKNIIEAIGDVDWGNKTLSVRINGLDTHYMYRDVVDLLEQASERLDLTHPLRVQHAVDVLQDQLEPFAPPRRYLALRHEEERSLEIVDDRKGLQKQLRVGVAVARSCVVRRGSSGILMASPPPMAIMIAVNQKMR